MNTLSKPNICVPVVEGTNCDYEAINALEVGGAIVHKVHFNELKDGSKDLGSYQGAFLPGGFGYGDALGSGVVQKIEMIAYLSDSLQALRDAHRPILGICNGFQVLVKSGLLPGGILRERTATLTFNSIGHFVCRWQNIAIQPSMCKFIQPEMFDEPYVIPMQVAHGEGRFVARDPGLLDTLKQNGQIVGVYADDQNNPTMTYPYNPNESQGAIAFMCDETGLVAGGMPHPERWTSALSLDDDHATRLAETGAQTIFRNFVSVAAQS